MAAAVQATRPALALPNVFPVELRYNMFPVELRYSFARCRRLPLGGC